MPSLFQSVSTNKYFENCGVVGLRLGRKKNRHGKAQCIYRYLRKVGMGFCVDCKGVDTQIFAYLRFSTSHAAEYICSVPIVLETDVL